MSAGYVAIEREGLNGCDERSLSQKYWAIAVPEGKGRSKDMLMRRLQGSAAVYEFKIPVMKTGTLDNLMQLSEDLGKVDVQIEAITKKFQRGYNDLLKAAPVEGKANDNSKRRERKNNDTAELKIEENLSKTSYLRSFSWNKRKYGLPQQSQMMLIKEQIVKDVNSIEANLKNQTSSYNEIRTQVDAVERKESGSLLVKTVDELINKKDMVNTEYFTTLLVVVPAKLEKEFLSTYEGLEQDDRRKAQKQQEEDAAKAAQHNNMNSNTDKETREEASAQAERDQMAKLVRELRSYSAEGEHKAGEESVKETLKNLAALNTSPTAAADFAGAGLAPLAALLELYKSEDVAAGIATAVSCLVHAAAEPMKAVCAKELQEGGLLHVLLTIAASSEQHSLGRAATRLLSLLLHHYTHEEEMNLLPILSSFDAHRIVSSSLLNNGCKESDAALALNALNSLTDHRSDDAMQVLADVCRKLADSLADERSAIAASHGARAVLGTMNTSTSSSNLVGSAVELFASLAQDGAESIEVLRSIGAVDSIVRLLEECKFDETVMQVAATALSVVTSTNTQQKADSDKNKSQASLFACGNIVPRSSKFIAKDTEFVLYSVVVFRKGEDYVKSLLRQQKFTVRSYNHDDSALGDYKKKRAEMQKTLRSNYNRLVTWSQTTFSEVFTSWITVKAMRIFVEAVLRYGLQDNGQPTPTMFALVQPKKGKEKQIRKSMEQEFSALGSAGLGGAGEENAEEFYAYVSQDIDISVE